MTITNSEGREIVKLQRAKADAIHHGDLDQALAIQERIDDILDAALDRAHRDDAKPW